MYPDAINVCVRINPTSFPSIEDCHYALPALKYLVSAAGSCWSPTIAASDSGEIAIAWDTYDKGDYDIWLRRFAADGKPLAVEAVAETEDHQARPALCYDLQGRLWCAWEQSGATWGKNWGALVQGQGIPLYQDRTVGLRVLDGDQWKVPLTSFKDVLPNLSKRRAVMRNRVRSPEAETETRQAGEEAETAAANSFNNLSRISCDKLEVNEHVIDLGEFEPARCPEAETRVAQIDWNQTIVAFPFVRKTREIPESVGLTFEFFQALGDRHKVLGVFEQPGKPPYEILFDSFEPDFLYFTDYAPSWSSQLGKFVVLGIEHILVGYDHILFLLGLLITSKFWQLVKIISSFTIAHTITLVLAATGVVTLPNRFVEVCIAATIVYVASENLLRTSTGERWMITFGFGLIHGFGFANVLREIELPREGLTRCLLAFNVGVEFGQLALVTAIWPLWMLVQRSKRSETISMLLSTIILLLGAAWFLERLLGLEFMPF